MEKFRYNANGGREWYLRTESQRSPRIGGKLQLRQNPYYKIEAVTLYHDGYGTGDVPNQGAMPALQDRALGESDVYKKVYSALESEARGRAKAAIAVDLAEGRQALDMIASTVGTLYKGARYIRRGNFIEAARTFRIRKPRGLSNRTEDFLNNWLAFRYGWIPMLSSIHDTWDALAIKSAPLSHRFRISRYGSQQSLGFDLRERVTARGFMRVTSPSRARLGAVGLANPAQIAWELLPGSFVLDWFLPIGDYLDTFDDFIGVEFHDFSITWTSYCEHEFYYANPGNPYMSMGWYPGKPPLTGAANRNPYSENGMAPYFMNHLHTKAKQKWRMLLSTPPRPIFDLVENGLNPKRLLDALALLTTVFRPLKRTGIPDPDDVKRS